MSDANASETDMREDSNAMLRTDGRTNERSPRHFKIPRVPKRARDFANDLLPSDTAFTLFLASFRPDQFSESEWDIFQYHRLHRV